MGKRIDKDGTDYVRIEDALFDESSHDRSTTWEWDFGQLVDTNKNMVVESQNKEMLCYLTKSKHLTHNQYESGEIEI